MILETKEGMQVQGIKVFLSVLGHVYATLMLFV